MAQPMPESVKVARAAHDIPTPTTIAGAKFDIKMGPDEVMILLAFHWWWNAGRTAGAGNVFFGLWRKSETMPAGTNCFVASPDMIWAIKDGYDGTATSTIKNCNQDFVNLPWPMILIRPPQFVLRTIMDGLTAEMRLYYLLREVNDVDLAKLMVKDHA